MAVSVSDNGISNDSELTSTTTILISIFAAIAVYNVVELIFIIFATFKRRGGLYFWSFMVATWGIAVYSIGLLTKFLQLSTNNVLYVTLIVVGWCSMVTGQSVVLYSRLHLLLRNTTILRAVLVMIIVDAVICHIPISVMVYGANSNNPEPFVTPYSIYEKVQVTIFFIQELIISGLYIFETVKLLRLETMIFDRKKGPNLLLHLVIVNVIIVLLDITILGLEYSGLYDIQTIYKGLVYSVKLKLEFSILNRLVELTTARNGSSYTQSAERGGNAVQLEPIDDPDKFTGIASGNSNNGNSSRRGGMGMGYQASIHTGGRNKDGVNMEATNNKSSAVFMTTEVVVQRSSASAADSAPDIESVDDGTSTKSAQGGRSRNDGARPAFSSSSQTELSKTWC
ncbi:hypothetical protein QBC46DRAFT_321435 [Diplogelasinospora grovesii]|uniref:DUF7703 domain-containing protein n=1 Tax=Diplogelasinospora grovesii TaxID=303347 RepID=A0AAN6N1K1_9PEZI|nr:hypothetical protein QBC46DRAFT_321435 [Diplogelasinospora grovesii]